jgi:O-antigen ligase
LWQKNTARNFRWAEPWLIPISLLIIAGLIGVLISPETLPALGIFKAYILESVLFFVILFTTLKWHDDPEPALIFLGLGAIAVSVFAIFQRVTGLTIPIPWDVEGRVTSVFPYPNAVGLFLGPIIPLGFVTFWQMLEEKYFLKAWFWILVTVSSTAAVIFSQTEAAWIAVPASLIVVSFFFKKTKSLAIVLIVPMIVITLVVPAFRSKIFLQDYSGGVRLKQWEETANMLRDNWLFGAGLSGYQKTLAPYHTYEEIEIFQYPHNIILNTWSELGLLGLLAFVATAWLVWKNLAAAKTENSPHLWLAVATSAALLEMVIHGLVDVPFFKNDLSILTAVCLALLAWSAHGPYARQNVKQQ